MPALIGTHSVSKWFGLNAALASVDYSVEPGEVHVLAGANGAGKSTLVKILYGAVEPDEGTITWKGQDAGRMTIARALALGIGYIAQEVHLVPQLSVAENMFLGHLPQRGQSRGLPEAAPSRRTWRPAPLVDYRALRREATATAARLGLRADLDAPAGQLSIAERQLVAIARALGRRAELLILDEPTAALSPAEIGQLFAIVQRLKSHGSGIIFISHRLEEIERIGDRVTVLRDGRVVHTGPVRGITRGELVEQMTGSLGARVPACPPGPVQLSRKAQHDAPQETAGLVPDARGVTPGEQNDARAPLLRVEEVLVPGRVGPLSFSVDAGEILGIAGVVGSGRTSLVRALFGAEPTAQGRAFVAGRRTALASPADAIRAGIALLTEDRKDQGLVPTADIALNISLASGRKFVRRMLFDHAAADRVARGYIERLSIRAPGPRFLARLLSGGNQQKVLFARWLSAGARIFLLDEPTRGIDVQARRQVYDLVRELAQAGNAVVFISSDLPEVLEVATRILVLHRGQCAGELAAGSTDEPRLLAMAMGS